MEFEDFTEATLHPYVPTCQTLPFGGPSTTFIKVRYHVQRQCTDKSQIMLQQLSFPDRLRLRKFLSGTG